MTIENTESRRCEESTSGAEDSASEIIKVSLWLVPHGESYETLQKQINMISKKRMTPEFVPHVTLVGGVQISSNEILDLLLKLKKGYSGFGTVPCVIKRSIGIIAGYHDRGRRKCPWSQSTVAILEREEKLIRAIEIAREILFISNDKKDQDLFKPPLCEPHISLAYANEPLGHMIQEIPNDFYCKEVALARTDPSSLEGVLSWEIIGRISLN